jgi:DNA polymerase-3 subunit epsilon
MGEMVGLAASVEAITCTTALEAEIRELRLIAEHKPRYNRRSKFPERATWLKLTVEPWPRISLVVQVLDDGADYLGPFRSRPAALSAMAALHESFPIRQCSGRFPREPRRSPCVLAEMGKCLSPCDGSSSTAAYALVVDRLRKALAESPHEVVTTMRGRMSTLAATERFEDARTHRDRMVSFVRAAARSQRLSALTTCSEVVAARRGDNQQWEVHVVRYGRLASAGVIPPGADAQEWTALLTAGAETVLPGYGPAPAATPEETERILHWLEQPGVRLVHVDGVWSCPLGGAESHRDLLDSIAASRDSLVPFDTPRLTSTLARPAR